MTNFSLLAKRYSNVCSIQSLPILRHPERFLQCVYLDCSQPCAQSVGNHEPVPPKLSPFLLSHQSQCRMLPEVAAVPRMLALSVTRKALCTGISLPSQMCKSRGQRLQHGSQLRLPPLPHPPDRRRTHPAGVPRHSHRQRDLKDRSDHTLRVLGWNGTGLVLIHELDSLTFCLED